jgi:hypothetical protein
MKGSEREKLDSKTTRNPAMRSEVESLMDESNKLLDGLWAKNMGASNRSNWIYQLCTCFGYEAT